MAKTSGRQQLIDDKQKLIAGGLPMPDAGLNAEAPAPVQKSDPQTKSPTLADIRTSSYTLTARERFILERFRSLMNAGGMRSYGHSTALKVALRLAEQHIDDQKHLPKLIDQVSGEDGRLKRNRMK
jgi:hypothetical protein